MEEEEAPPPPPPRRVAPPPVKPAAAAPPPRPAAPPPRPAAAAPPKPAAARPAAAPPPPVRPPAKPPSRPAASAPPPPAAFGQQTRRRRSASGGAVPAAYPRENLAFDPRTQGQPPTKLKPAPVQEEEIQDNLEEKRGRRTRPTRRLRRTPRHWRRHPRQGADRGHYLVLLNYLWPRITGARVRRCNIHHRGLRPRFAFPVPMSAPQYRSLILDIDVELLRQHLVGELDAGDVIAGRGGLAFLRRAFGR